MDTPVGRAIFWKLCVFAEGRAWHDECYVKAPRVWDGGRHRTADSPPGIGGTIQFLRGRPRSGVHDGRSERTWLRYLHASCQPC